MPPDVVHPWAPNEHILIMTGIQLIYWCDGQLESRITVTTRIYRVTVESLCILYGNNRYLIATFQRYINVSLQADTTDFTLNSTFTNLLTNFSDFHPLQMNWNY